MQKIAAILMAAGFSKRFQAENKLLAPVGGKPLARHTIELVCRSDLFSQRILISADKRVAALGEDLPVTPLHNDNPARGQCESIRLGVEAADADYYMFFPCDQPFLTERILQMLVQAAKPGCIVVPEVAGVPASPALFSAVFREELLSLPDRTAGKAVIRAHPEAVIHLQMQDPAAFADIDTREDIRQVGCSDFKGQ